ncbi:hypothetical protein BD309DRAFT_970757 [Dichomitus squalens]|nr:hypothetical protein BD309DRAFT_970757 [Dichomitus squalens]
MAACAYPNVKAKRQGSRLMLQCHSIGYLCGLSGCGAASRVRAWKCTSANFTLFLESRTLGRGDTSTPSASSVVCHALGVQT